jgi:hypothetical protein
MQLEKNSLGESEVTPLEEIKQLVESDEEMGYGAPFVTISWEQWLEMQARIFQNMARFQRAIADDQRDRAFFAALEVQEIATLLLKEAGAYSSCRPTTMRCARGNCGRRE